MSCNHRWVNYQPFRGESYWCCANAGCGIKHTEYLAQYRPIPAPISPGEEDAIKTWPAYKPWEPVDLGEYFLPKGLSDWIPKPDDEQPPGDKL